MTNILKQERDDEVHSRYSMFVVCILAHGENNKVFGIDGLDTSGAVDISEMTSWFSSTNCSSLAGKPKLFFIQACQGGKEMLSVAVKSRVLEDASATGGVTSDAGDRQTAPAVAMETNDCLLSDARPEAKPQSPTGGGGGDVIQPNADDKQDEVKPLNVPDAADTLIAHSTAPGYKSWRHPELGSWFIRCLVYVTRHNVCEDHVVDILTDVARIISHFKVEHGHSYAVQTPQIVSTLRKRVFFMP